MFARSLKLGSLTIFLLLFLLPYASPPMLSEAQTEPAIDLTGEWRGNFTLWSQVLVDRRVERCFTNGTIVITILTQSGDRITGGINAEIDFTGCPIEAEWWVGNYLSGLVEGRVSGIGTVRQIDMVVGFSGLPLSGSCDVTTNIMKLGYQGDGDTLEVTLRRVEEAVEEPFDFSISVTPSEKTVIKGGSASYLVTVTLVQGRAEPVILLPPKSDEQLGFISDPSSGTPPFNSVLTVSTSDATKLGRWWFTIGAEGGGVYHETDKIYLIVEEAVEEPFDFNISISPATKQVVVQGGSVAYTVAVSLKSGKAEPVTLFSPRSDGLRYTFNPPSGIPPFTSTLTVSTSNTTQLGEWWFQIGGEGGGIRHTTDRIYLVVKTVSKISCEVSETTVSIGDRITVSGSINPIHPNATVTITYTKPDGSTIIRNVVTSSTGNYRDTYTPDMAGSWRVKASWAGDTGHEGATSSLIEFTVKTAPARFKVESLEVSPLKAAIGQNVTISVKVSNVGEGAGSHRVTLSINDTVEAVREVALAPMQSHTVSFIVVKNVAGTYNVRVDGLNARFEVGKIPSSITLNIIPSTFSVGGSAKIDGSISPPHEASALIELKAAGGSTWSTLTTVTTGADGSYSYTWTLEKAGRYEVRASWQGDRNHQAAVSPTRTVTVEEKKCIIATAAYGSELNPHIQFLREFREKIVLKTFAGRQFMNLFNAWYYSFSPSVATFISKHESIKTVIQGTLYPLIGILHLGVAADKALSFQGELGIIITGLTVSALIGAVYLTPLTIIPLYAFKKWRKSLPKLCRPKILLLPWITSVSMTLLGEATITPTLMMAGTGTLVLSTITLAAGTLTLKAVQRMR